MTELLDMPIYVMSDVDRVLGLRGGTARRWIDGYSVGAKVYEPVIRAERTGDDVVTWGELVETRHLAGFRSQRVRLQRLRPTFQRLREEFGSRYPLALAAPFLDVEGREVVRRVQVETGDVAAYHFVVVRNGQLTLAAATEQVVDASTFSGDPRVVTQFRPLPDRAGSVVVDPLRNTGSTMRLARGLPAGQPGYRERRGGRWIASNDLGPACAPT